MITTFWRLTHDFKTFYRSPVTPHPSSSDHHPRTHPLCSVILHVVLIFTRNTVIVSYTAVRVEPVLPAGVGDPSVRGAAAVATHHHQNGHREVSRCGHRGGQLWPGTTGRLPALHGHPPGFPASASLRGHGQRGHHDVHVLPLDVHRVLSRKRKSSPRQKEKTKKY